MRSETYDHSYPHCWRCRNPLIYKAVSSWFVEVTAFRDRMVELNEQITWVPEHVKHGQFGKWLSNARDWSISRNRFWGSPIPVWKSDDPTYPRVDVYGSLEELQRDFGVEVTDLHRPYVDELTRPNPDDPTGRSTMRRVPEVLDVWFDSGSMSFAQVHYPFENTEWFEHHFPGDFIVEYIGQTRGWFYTLHVLATALFDRPAFKSCVSHGIVLGNDGQKMSKSLRNYPDVTEVFDRDGADAMRWFLMSSPILRGGNLVVTEQAIRDGVRQTMLPLWNTWAFFALYANVADGGAGYAARWSTASENVLDRYLLATTRSLVEQVQAALDALDVAGACDLVRAHVDTLTNWYVRRSRQRFWDEDHDAFDTLYTALEVLCRVAAPLLPMVTEEVWRGLTGGRSVHLTDWPEADDLPYDDGLVATMETVRQVCSSTSAMRKAEGLRVRLPLTSLTVVASGAADLAPFADLVTSEVNVREVRLLDLADAGEQDFGIERRLRVDARAAGPRLGKDVQLAIRGSKSGDWSVADDGTVTSGGIALQDGEFELETVRAPGRRRRLAGGRHAARRRVRRPRHPGDARARGHRAGERRRARRAAGAARGRPAGVATGSGSPSPARPTGVGGGGQPPGPAGGRDPRRQSSAPAATSRRSRSATAWSRRPSATGSRCGCGSRGCERTAEPGSGGSCCTTTAAPVRTSTCGWRRTACCGRGRCRRVCRTTPPTTGSPWRSTTTTSTTSTTPTSTSRSPTRAPGCEEDRSERRTVFRLHGRDGVRRYALIHTGGEQWLLHLTKDQPG